MTTKILALVDVLDNLVSFTLLLGQRDDIVAIEPLNKDKAFDALFAGKAFDADWLLEELNEKGYRAVIPLKSHRKEQRAYERYMYTWHHLVENFFCDLKAFKKIAMRSEKADRSFAANIYLTAAVMALR